MAQYLGQFLYPCVLKETMGKCGETGVDGTGRSGAPAGAGGP